MAGLAAGLAGICVLAFSAWVVVPAGGVRRRVWKSLVAALCTIVAVFLCLLAAMVALTAPSDPEDGVDGSGVPCRSSI